MIRITLKILAVALILGAIGCGATKQNAPAEIQFCAGTQLAGQCLVRSFQQSAVYITTHQHSYCPESLRLKVVSDEPQGRKEWTLNRDQFSVSPNSDKKDTYNAELMQALLFSLSSSAGLLPELKLGADEQLKVEGKWYDVYQYAINNTTIGLFQNKSTHRYELVTVKNGSVWLQAQSYNLWYDKNLGRSIPRTIDIFDISEGLSSKKLLMQVEYISLESSGR